MKHQQNRFWKPNPQAMANAGAIAQSGDTDTWLTPQWILDGLGPFDLDPCPYPGNPTRCAPNYLEDGLAEQWVGRVFCNPPYSNTAEWLQRHGEHGRGVSLVPATVESIAWRRHVWPRAKAIYFLHGRTRFCNTDGSTTTGRPLRSVCLIGWDDSELEVFKTLPFAGVLLVGWDQR